MDHPLGVEEPGGGPGADPQRQAVALAPAVLVPDGREHEQDRRPRLAQGADVLDLEAGDRTAAAAVPPLPLDVGEEGGGGRLLEAVAGEQGGGGHEAGASSENQ